MFKIFAISWSVVRQYIFYLLLFCLLITTVHWTFQRFFYSLEFIPLDYVFMTILKGAVCSFLYLSQLDGKASFKNFFKGFDKILPFTHVAVTVIVIEKVLNLSLNYFNPGMESVKLTNFYSYFSKLIVVTIYGEQSALLVFVLVLILPLLLALKMSIVLIATKQGKFWNSLMMSFRVLYKKPLELVIGFILFQTCHFYAIELLYVSEVYWFAVSTIVFVLQIVYFYSLFKAIEPELFEEEKKDLLDEFGKKA